MAQETLQDEGGAERLAALTVPHPLRLLRMQTIPLRREYRPERSSDWRQHLLEAGPGASSQAAPAPRKGAVRAALLLVALLLPLLAAGGLKRRVPSGETRVPAGVLFPHRELAPEALRDAVTSSPAISVADRMQLSLPMPMPRPGVTRTPAAERQPVARATEPPPAMPEWVRRRLEALPPSAPAAPASVPSAPATPPSAIAPTAPSLPTITPVPAATVAATPTAVRTSTATASAVQPAAPVMPAKTRFSPERRLRSLVQFRTVTFVKASRLAGESTGR